MMVDNIIGQNNLLGTLKSLADNNSMPRFMILSGAKGSGKKTIADIIPTLFSGSDYTYTLPDVKVDTVREAINQSYKITNRTFYIIPDADNMSLAAKNSILKVTEEPPNNAYFIITVEDENKLLDTIKSRGQLFRMDKYSPTEIYGYAKGVTDNTLTTDEAEVIIDICETPGEVNTILSMKVLQFYDYVNTVVDNIAEVSGSNSFKIVDKINVKDDPDKYDLKLFWKAFMKVCIDRAREEQMSRYARGVTVTSKYMQELYITGINKQSTFDMWLLDIRANWIDWEN